MKPLLCVFLMLATLTGCATVQPWQRGTLARADMQLRYPAADQTLCDHIFAAKEAASGGMGAHGGGCGCN